MFWIYNTHEQSFPKSAQMKKTIFLQKMYELLKWQKPTPQRRKSYFFSTEKQRHQRKVKSSNGFTCYKPKGKLYERTRGNKGNRQHSLFNLKSVCRNQFQSSSCRVTWASPWTDSRLHLNTQQPKKRRWTKERRFFWSGFMWPQSGSQKRYRYRRVRIKLQMPFDRGFAGPTSASLFAL